MAQSVRKLLFLMGMALCVLPGCGTTKSRLATEQLLMSDAVDRAVADIDFRPLSNKSVYFDTQYIHTIKGFGFVNAEYIISSLRQQMVSAGCLLQDARDEANYIVEARVGALGTDSHDVTFGLPASNALSTAASLVPNAPTIPVIPEISFARRNDQVGAAKIGVFAYRRDDRAPVWQAGLSQARSSSKDVWILGAGPFQRGTIHDGVRFAGSQVPLIPSNEDQGLSPIETYAKEVHFLPEDRRRDDTDVEQASHSEKESSPDED